MFSSISRRNFVVRSVQTGALAGVADFAFLQHLHPVSAAAAKVTPAMVQLNPDIEPLVRLIEETDREKLLEVVADRVRKGTSYGQLLAAVLLAGVRGIQPRPVGFLLAWQPKPGEQTPGTLGSLEVTQRWAARW